MGGCSRWLVGSMKLVGAFYSVPRPGGWSTLHTMDGSSRFPSHGPQPRDIRRPDAPGLL